MQSRRKRQSPFEVARFWCEKKSDPPGFQVDMFKYKGRGIKSLINRSKGDFLLEYAGELISSDEGDLRETKGSSGFRFFFRDFCIDATEETGRYGRLVNHGEKKERNAVMKLVGSNTLCIFAARDIKENEEILYDYGIQSKCLPWKKLDSQAGQGYAVGMQKDLNIDTLEHDDEASEELHCKKSSSDLQEPENETSVPHCRDSCSVDHERYKEQAPVEPDNKTRYCSNPSGPYIEAPIETDNKASSSKDHEEPDSEIPVEPDSKASYCSNPSEPYIEAPIETDNKASSSKDHGESDSKIPVEPDNITRYCNNPSEPYIEAPIETDNKASSSIDHGESDSKIPVEPDNITRYCSNPSESYIEAPIETDNKASSSKDHGEPDSEIPVELDNKASYCSNPSEPYIEAPIETDNKASSSKDHGEPNSEIPVEPDNKASYCSNPSEPYNEAPIETDNKASSSKDHGESDSEIPVEPDNKTSYCSNPSEPYNEAPIETDNKASSSKDHGELDSEIPVGPDNITRYCSNPSEPYNEAPIETDNKASSCKVHGESDSEIPVGPDNKTSYCSNPSEPYNEAPIETDNKASSCKVHGEPDSEIPVGPDNKTSYCSNPSEPNIEAPIETDNKASSSKDHEEPDSEIPVEPDNKTSYCIRSDSVILVEPYNNTSFIHVGAAPIELHNSNCCTKDILTDNTRSRSRLKQVDSLKRKRHRENMVSKHRFEKKLKLKVPSSNLPRSLNDNLQGNGKKQVACVKPRTRSKTDNTSENMQERDDYLDDDQSDDDFDNDESSGSEYVPESCEDKDDDEDELSDEFPLQSKAQDKIHKENTDIDSRSQTDGGTYQSSITKAFFKNISLEAYCPNKGGKRNYSKTQYCLFCKSKLNSKISKHLFSVHYNEKRVSAIKKLPLRSMERKFALQKIQKEGNYEHNVQVLKKGSGTLIIYRRPSESSKCHPSEYIPCEYCFGFYHERNLWEHSKSCPERTVGVDTPSNYVRNGRLMLVPFINREECEKQELDLLIEKMKETVQHPGLKNICTNDKLIREFGMALVDKLGTPEEQRRKDHDNVRTKMRSVARLLKKLNENKLTNLPLSHFICAKEFMTVVSAVKCLSRDADSPNFAVTLGNYVKQITLLKASLGLQEDDNRSRQEAKDFQDLYTAHWNSKVSCVANRTKRLRALNQSIQLPSTEDLVKLKDYLLKEIENGIKIKKPTYEHFVWMTQVVTARIVLFNKRRIGEVDELKMQDFEKRTKGEEAGTNTEIVNSLNITERALLNRIELVEVRGKSTRGLRKVFILLTPDMVKGIDYLLSVRIYVGINPESVFVFGRTSDTPQDGCSAMRIVSEACPGLSNPTLIRTRLLRKYLATTSQVMDMTSEELKLVADHMGHSIAIHTDIYKLQSSILERTKVARALVALENGSLTKFKGKTLESIDIDELPVPALEELDEVDELPASVREEPDDDVDDELLLPVHEELSCENVNGTETKSKGIKRKRWSPDEERAFKEAFNCHIIGKKNASTEEIRKARLKYTDLQNRTESMIRVKLNNIVLGKCKV